MTFYVDGLEAAQAQQVISELSSLPFGMLYMDRQGRVIVYYPDETEGSSHFLSGITGQSFFTEIAPCISEMGVRRCFEDGADACRLNLLLEFTLSDSQVRLHIKNAKMDRVYWLSIKKM